MFIFSPFVSLSRNITQTALCLSSNNSFTLFAYKNSLDTKRCEKTFLAVMQCIQYAPKHTTELWYWRHTARDREIRPVSYPCVVWSLSYKLKHWWDTLLNVYNSVRSSTLNRNRDWKERERRPSLQDILLYCDYYVRVYAAQDCGYQKCNTSYQQHHTLKARLPNTTLMPLLLQRYMHRRRSLQLQPSYRQYTVRREVLASSHTHTVWENFFSPQATDEGLSRSLRSGFESVFAQVACRSHTRVLIVHT